MVLRPRRTMAEPGAQKPAVVILGTGSGAVALSVAAGLAGAEVAATDRSPDALAMAQARLWPGPGTRGSPRPTSAPTWPGGCARWSPGSDRVRDGGVTVAILAALGDPPPPGAVAAAIRALAAGRIIAIPTDTVYGLAVDPFRTGAADRLFALKRRSRDVDLPVLVADVEQALSMTLAVPEPARRLMARFWPGAITLVLPRSPDVSADLGRDEATIGVRCPAHPLPRALCAATGPLATTSANLHGEPTLVTAAEVEATFGDAVPLVLDGGPCAGAPSTVVDCTGEEPKLLREGRVSWADVLRAARSST